jgi:hypothetical protein
MTFKTKILFSLISIITIGVFLTSSCKKSEQFAEGNVSLKFSNDTILFDTLFSTIGSSTYTLLVSNPENKNVNISQLYLGGGQQSSFRMNVDGISAYKLTDVVIPAHDSIYIFVEVTIDPNSGTGPMLVTDSIIFETNGNIQDVNLIAYGIDAYFILPNRNISGLPPFNIVAGENTDTTWTNDKPIVIYGYAVVDSTASLTIEAGTKIYFHNNSGLWIYKGGNLKVMGTLNNPVSFQGDRPEEYYDDIPGQWDRIWINEGSVDNEINYAVIKNGFIGIQAELLQQDMGNKIKIKNTVIENMSGVGILSRAHSIDGENIKITNCKQYDLALTMGGSYEFRHCTFANFWNYDVRKTPLLYVNNYFKDADDNIYPFDLDKANFYNCIIYGNGDEEIVLDENSNGGSFNYLFDHALIKSQIDISNNNVWKSTIKNQTPDFKEVSKNNLHLGDNSAAIEKGKAGVLPTIDLDGVSRDASLPDLGAYEYVQ